MALSPGGRGPRGRGLVKTRCVKKCGKVARTGPRRRKIVRDRSPAGHAPALPYPIMTGLMSVGAVTLVVLLYWSLADFVLDRLGPPPA